MGLPARGAIAKVWHRWVGGKGGTSLTQQRQSILLSFLILFQVLCLVIFILDVGSEALESWKNSQIDWRTVAEMLATVGLFVGIVFEVGVLIHLVRRQVSLEKGLSVAAGALAQVMADYFSQWGLTPSEHDIAAFTIKGYSISEIAALRGSAEGTIKTHLNAIYRKAGVSGRAQLVSLLVEDLMQAPLTIPPPTR